MSGRKLRPRSKIIGLISIMISSQLLFLPSVFATDDRAPLDPPYPRPLHPVQLSKNKDFSIALSPIEEVIAWQTPVKSQEFRGSCSIFSAIGLLESLLQQNGNVTEQLDLSEEWLSYVTNRTQQEDGSNAPRNFDALKKHGVAREKAWLYDGNIWEDVSSGVANERCGEFKDKALKSCLIAHRNPYLLGLDSSVLMNRNNFHYDEEFVTIRQEAYDFRDQWLNNRLGLYQLQTQAGIRQQLLAGIPVILEIDFYYGAWNHRKANEYGIGRDLDSWNGGIVGYPEKESVDYLQSSRHPAGHSFIIVGYDDNRIVKTQVLMNNGEKREFKYRGVYYFKNSWGTEGFGSTFEFNGKKYPGYGMISYRYAHEMGAFFRATLNGEQAEERFEDIVD